MKNLNFLFCLLFSISLSSQVTTATKQIVKKFAKEISKEGLGKTSKAASVKISKKLSNSPVKKLTFIEHKNLIDSKLDKPALEKFLKRLEFNKKEVEILYQSLGNDRLKKIYFWLTTDMDKIVKKNFLMDVQDISFFKYLNSSSSNRRAYEKAVFMGRKFRKNKDVLNQIKNNASPIKLITRNNALEGTTKLGVKFLRKIITLPNGLKVSGVFPVFKHISKVKLPDYLLNKPDVMQMNYAFMKFRKELMFNPKLQSKFSSNEINEMLGRKITSAKKAQYKVKRYTWHHSEETSVLELVETDIHKAISHDGGSAIWAGGKVYKINTTYKLSTTIKD